MSDLDNEHARMVEALAKPGSQIVKEMSPSKAHCLHMAVGIAGEAGELLDAVKKHVIYNKPLDMENVMEELGDIEFYMHGLRNMIGMSRDETLNHNLNKLQQRYAEGKYSDKQAQNRADKLK